MPYFTAYSLLLLLIVNSSYLSYKYINFYFGGNLLNNLNCTDGCDSVMMSQYAMLFGIPVPVYGLAFFIALTIAFVLFQRGILQHIVIDLAVVTGLLAASVFLYILYFQLHMMCKFCLASHILTALFAVNYFGTIRKRYSN